MKIALSPLEKFRAAGKFLDCTFNKRPLTVSIEVTKRCNARCDFCDYWKISDRDELTDFTDVIRRFDPMIVVFTGGEPMLRRDLVPIVKSIKELPGFRYLTLLTHGGFLSEPKIKELIAAGVNQINISMNYPDARQDKERGIPGLFDRLHRTVPKMVRDGYNDLKNGNQAHFVSKAKMEEFRAVCRRILELKRELGNVMTSDYFFQTLPTFYERREIGGCQAGKVMIHVTPKGMVQPCAELEPIAHYSEFLPGSYEGPNCGKCFDACRSEPEAPLTLRRLGELAGVL